MNSLTKQNELQLVPVKQAEIDGIMMGVLNDGTPYLTARGLARLCGVVPSVIISLGSNWAEEQHKPRGSKIATAIQDQGGDVSRLFIETVHEGQDAHAYTDTVCMAVLEYYAFDAGKWCTGAAKMHYRLLARESLRSFIYDKLGYHPDKAWNHFHERLLLNDVPVGYFSVFKESSELIIRFIRAGVDHDPRTIPDISIGKHYSKAWGIAEIEGQVSNRKKWPHYFPSDYPQSEASIDAWIYPVEALPHFRKWLDEVYVPTLLEPYLSRKSKKGQLHTGQVQVICDALIAKKRIGDVA